jgi:hypothetical protein
MTIDDHIKLHCPLTFFPQNKFSPYKKGTQKSNTMAKDIRGTQSGQYQSLNDETQEIEGIMMVNELHNITCGLVNFTPEI